MCLDYILFLYVFSYPCAVGTDIVSILILIFFHLLFQTTLRNKFVNLNWIHVCYNDLVLFSIVF